MSNILSKTFSVAGFITLSDHYSKIRFTQTSLDLHLYLKTVTSIRVLNEHTTLQFMRRQLGARKFERAVRSRSIVHSQKKEKGPTFLKIIIQDSVVHLQYEHQEQNKKSRLCPNICGGERLENVRSVQHEKERLKANY